MNYTITGNYKGQKCLKNYIYLLVVIHLPFLLIAYKKDAVQRKRPRGLGQRGRCPPAPSIATAPWLRKSSPTKEAKGGRAIPSSTGGCPRSAERWRQVSSLPTKRARGLWMPWNWVKTLVVYIFLGIGCVYYIRITEAFVSLKIS